MTEDVQYAIGGCSTYDKLFVTCSLGVVKSLGGKETHTDVVKATPQGPGKGHLFWDIG